MSPRSGREFAVGLQGLSRHLWHALGFYINVWTSSEHACAWAPQPLQVMHALLCNCRSAQAATCPKCMDQAAETGNIEAGAHHGMFKRSCRR